MFRDTKAFSGFSVDDIGAARRFYGEILGLDVSEINGMLSLHTAGGRDVLIYPKPDHQPASFTVLNFEVPDVEVAVDALAVAGVSTEKYDWVDERGINRRGGPLIAWF
jgi:catechol 2,3-dioxygenase-like lactoylglutathione lyase family enzyme